MLELKLLLKQAWPLCLKCTLLHLILENCTPVIKADNTNQLRPNKTFGILKTENNVCSGFTKSLYNFLFFTETADFMAIFAERGKYANNHIV